MEKICVQCGDIGYETKLVYCFKCRQAARHRYCMDILPKTNEVVRWLCDECESLLNRSSSKKSRKIKHVVSESDDQEISIEKLKNHRSSSKESRKRPHIVSESDDDQEISIEQAKNHRSSSEKSRKSDHKVTESDDDQEISIEKSKNHRSSLEKSRKSDHKVTESDDDQEISIEKSKNHRSSLEKSRKSDHKVSKSDDDQEIPSKNSKKNQTGDHKSGDMRNSFLHSFSGFQGINDHLISNQEKQSYEPVIYGEPLIRSIWTGIFDIFCGDSIYRKLGGVNGFSSSKACQKVFNMATQFQPVLQFEIVPKSYVWPKGFQESGPTDDNIALYFFPSLMKHENVYDYLVFEMIRDDLAMRAFVQNVELLIFTSVVLPSRFWRFQGKLYLWGIFRGKQAPVDM
ncbi:hypothetical protein DH2020_003572 [Rehmannia glutinosa]|uniref:AIPP2-like SPOC-like domain-containing protein n=1 Tax=Rehmannia glutinosa TaxID=99300 RepID=A0ABR0XM02_REHGL